MQSNPPIYRVRYLSLGQWLADQLATAIAQLDGKTHSGLVIALPPFSCSTRQFGTLASPLLLQLASQRQTTPSLLGTQLISQLTVQACSPFKPTFSLQAEGWLYAHFCDLALAQWLQTLWCQPPLVFTGRSPKLEAEAVEIRPGVSTDPLLFQLQYAHARCWSLLRLAAQEYNLEQPTKQGTPSEYPSGSPWLTKTQLLCLTTPAEQHLLLQLMQFPGSIATQKQIYGIPHRHWMNTATCLEQPLDLKRLRRSSQTWSEAVLAFYRDCRMFGDLYRHSPDLVRSRITLVSIVQQVLQVILNQFWHIEAPTTL
ncbi:MAG TPA: DALR anticodon-binding domain-containing protein [Stenomitos sp.]